MTVKEAALTEAVFFRDRDILVVGGANSAGQAAVFFSRYVHSVGMVIRSQGLEVGMSQYLVDQIRAIPNIYLIPNGEVVEACGSDRLEAVNVINRETRQVSKIKSAAMFIFIGAVPHSELAGSLVERDSAGFIRTGPDLIRNGQPPSGWSLKRDPFLLETSCPGIFAAGDVTNIYAEQVLVAVGDGAKAALSAYDFLLPMLWTFLAGVLMWLLTRRHKGELSIPCDRLDILPTLTAICGAINIPAEQEHIILIEKE